MPRLRPLDGDPPLDGDARVRVGRGADVDLRIPRDTVSSLHAAIEWQGDGWYLRDLGSSNGTALDGAFVRGWTKLTAGAQIEFGPGCRYVVEAVDPPADSSRRSGPAALPPAPARRRRRVHRTAGGVAVAHLGRARDALHAAVRAGDGAARRSGGPLGRRRAPQGGHLGSQGGRQPGRQHPGQAHPRHPADAGERRRAGHADREEARAHAWVCCPSRSPSSRATRS